MRKFEVSSNVVYLPRSGNIYLVNAIGTDSFKIGMTKQPVLQRINTLQTGCPLRLRYVYHSYVEDMQTTERELHQLFNSFREIGEWFCLKDFQVKECIRLMRLMQVQEPSSLAEVEKSEEPYDEENLTDTESSVLAIDALSDISLKVVENEPFQNTCHNLERKFTTMGLSQEQAVNLIQRLRSELNQTQIIERLWECKKGGSEAWKKAYTQFKELTNEKE